MMPHAPSPEGQRATADEVIQKAREVVSVRHRYGSANLTNLMDDLEDLLYKFDGKLTRAEQWQADTATLLEGTRRAQQELEKEKHGT